VLNPGVIPVEKQVLDLINAERASRGLTILTFNSKLLNAARFHAQDMADNNFFGHIGSNSETLGDRLVAFALAEGDHLRAEFGLFAVASNAFAEILALHEKIGIFFGFRGIGDFGEWLDMHGQSWAPAPGGGWRQDKP
jgi:hypothetical protein